MKTFWMKQWTERKNKNPVRKPGFFMRKRLSPVAEPGFFQKDRHPGGSLVGVFFDKPDIEVSHGFGDAVDASGLAVLPEGKAVRGFGDLVVVGIPDDDIVKARHIEDIGFCGAVCVNGGYVPCFFDFLAESDSVFRELFF